MSNVPITTPPPQWQTNWLAANPGKTAADAQQAWNTPNFGIAATPGGTAGNYTPDMSMTGGIDGGGARAAIGAAPQGTTQADRMNQIQANQQALQSPSAGTLMLNPQQQQLNALNRVQQYFQPPTNFLSSNNPQGAQYQPSGKFGGMPPQQSTGGGKMMNQPNSQWYGYNQPQGGKSTGGGKGGYAQPYYRSSGGSK